ncbi:hypothetical protein GCM10010402_34840 [Actinomadura luteofluorescens]|uniref:trypsin-like serine peptidase n=2 Tax=Actinomadura luteofluorescens TaxID=46163 RepID=UPI0031DFCEDA
MSITKTAVVGATTLASTALLAASVGTVNAASAQSTQVAAAMGAAAPASDAQGRTVADTSTSVRISAAESGSASRYWTERRMAAATPLDLEDGAATGQQLTAQSIPVSKPFGGVPTVGALFSNDGHGDHYCTASVVHSSSQRLLITAAHCIHGGKGKTYRRNVVFVPKYDRGHRPYGMWTAGMLMVDQRWASKSDPDLDFGFIALNTRNGTTIQKAVGYNKLSINRGVGRTVDVFGYPDARERPISCHTKTARYSKYQIRMDCTGFTRGTSGSPWLLGYNGKTHTGSINGVIGGFHTGGHTASRSYSAYFDKDVANLRSAADKRAR